MSAVFSSALSTNAPKTRFAKSSTQTSKAAKSANHPTNHSSSYQPTNQASGGKWKRSIHETGMDSQPGDRSPTNGSEPLAKEPRVGSPEDGKVCNGSESRKRYLGEKAATIEMPTAEAAELCPKFLYDDRTLIIHMCLPCRIASRTLEMQIVDDDNQQLAVNLCKICRSTFKSQLGVKFFKHDLPCVKRQLLDDAAKNKVDKKDLKKFVL